jgi:hypothetical protein
MDMFGLPKDFGRNFKPLASPEEMMKEAMKSTQDVIANIVAKTKPQEPKKSDISGLPDLEFSSMRSIGGESGYRNFNMTTQNPLLTIAQQTLDTQKKTLQANEKMLELMRNNKQGGIPESFYAFAG